MKHPLITMSLFGLLGASFCGSAAILGYAPVAQAANSNIEATIQSYGDLSMFYQAMLNSGVFNELRENQNYTIFAPTNAAFAQIRRTSYPCFYAVQCRPQIAALLRNHILAGRYDLADLTSYGYGVEAAGGRILHVEEPYAGQFTVAGQNIISKTDVGGNIIYRIDGVIASPQDLVPFQGVTYVSTTTAAPVVTEKTVTRTYHRAPAPVIVAPDAYPEGTMILSPSPDNAGSTTTVTHTYIAPE